MADEAATSLARVRSLHGDGALSGVSIKPPRLGGIAAAVELQRWCLDTGVAACAGGMVESGLGRHALAAIAALPGFTLTGDLSPARRWLEVDPWPDLEMISGRISVPTAPGIAPPPNEQVLDRHTIRRAEIS